MFSLGQLDKFVLTVKITGNNFKFSLGQNLDDANDKPLAQIYRMDKR
jgi:hypothetical protein